MYKPELTRVKELFKAIRWLLSDSDQFKKELTENFGVTNLKVYKFMSWHHGAYYFTGSYKKQKVFIKTDFKLNLLCNEVLVVELLRKKSILNGFILEPILYDKSDYHFLVYNFVNAITLDEYVKNTIVSKESLFSIIDQIIIILDKLYQLKIVYRDLKLENFFIHNNNLIIFDFSFAINPDLDGGLRELNLSNEENIKILSMMGQDSQKKSLVWDDAYGAKTLLNNINSKFKYDISEKLLEVSKRINRLEYTFDKSERS